MTKISCSISKLILTDIFFPGQTRHLTSLPNCTPRAITQFPHGMFTQDQRTHGAVIVNILIGLYMFVGFAIICDDYFVPSLEIMCDGMYTFCCILYILLRAPTWPWSYGSWIYNYLCKANQCLSTLMLWVRISIRARCATLCDKVCPWLATGLWFSSGPPVSSTKKTDRHDITEILLIVDPSNNQTTFFSNFLFASGTFSIHGMSYFKTWRSDNTVDHSTTSKVLFYYKSVRFMRFSFLCYYVR